MKDEFNLRKICTGEFFKSVICVYKSQILQSHLQLCFQKQYGVNSSWLFEKNHDSFRIWEDHRNWFIRFCDRDSVRKKDKNSRAGSATESSRDIRTCIEIQSLGHRWTRPSGRDETMPNPIWIENLRSSVIPPRLDRMKLGHRISSLSVSALHAVMRQTMSTLTLYHLIVDDDDDDCFYYYKTWFCTLDWGSMRSNLLF